MPARQPPPIPPTPPQVYKGHENDRAKLALGAGSTLHPFVEGAAEVLKEAWLEVGSCASPRMLLTSVFAMCAFRKLVGEVGWN